MLQPHSSSIASGYNFPHIRKSLLQMFVDNETILNSQGTPQVQMPDASTYEDGPSGYHPQPTHSRRGTASPNHAKFHPSISPSSSLPISTEAESFRKRAYDISSVHTGHHPVFVEKDSPPSSNICSQSSQPPHASQKMPLYSRQPQASYGETAGGTSSQVGPLSSRFSPPGGYTNAPQVEPSQQSYRLPQSGTVYPMPHSMQASQYPIPGYHGTNTSPNILETPQSGPIPHIHSTNFHHPHLMKSDSNAPLTRGFRTIQT